MHCSRKKSPELEIRSIFEKYHRPEFLHLDPLSLLRPHLGEPDLEWRALLAALFAFGGVKQIQAALVEATRRLESKIDWNENQLRQKLKGFKHRIYVGDDVASLLLLYRWSCQQFGSLQGHFERYYQTEAETVGPMLTRVIEDYRHLVLKSQLQVGTHFGHLLNSPESGGACKRWLMYLKWMVRPDDGIDLGHWSGGRVRTDQLVIPLDVHLHRISQRFKLTRLKSANFKAAVEVTRSLKKMDPADPTKFDFALCRNGMIQSRTRVRHRKENVCGI